jgi:hypothetical protein
MRLNKLTETKRPRFWIPLITFVTVIVVAVFFAGCKGDETNKGGGKQATTTGPSPSPSPSPTGTPGGTEMIPGDTIIVIKDGSVEIEVNLTLCKDVSNTVDTIFKCDGVDLDAATIRNDKGHPPARCPKVNKLSRISIDGGGAKPIVVQGTVFNSTIKFKKPDYPLCGTGPGKYCGTNNVGTITVDANYTKPCDPAEKCEIWVHKK